MRFVGNWLRRRFWRRSRNIFEYFDGTRLRRIDPAQAVRSLDTSKEFDWEQDPGLIEFGNAAALQRTVKAVQKAFDVRPFSTSGTNGLTESETVELLMSFCNWLVYQKKSGSGLLISPTSTESKSSPNPPVTNETSDSGSTSNDSSSETASPSA